MGIEYSPAIDMFTPGNFFDPSYMGGTLSSLLGSELSIVIHKTACNGFCTATSVAQFFSDPNSQKSTHFVVGKDGSVIQCVHFADGAWGNCCLEQGHDPYWDYFHNKYGNLNFCTISIEHEDWTVDNTDPMTIDQIHASYQLVQFLVDKFHIPLDHIKGHNTLDPISRKDCPGNYDMNALIAYLKGNQPVVVNPYQRAAFVKEWTAVVAARTDSGIANAAWEMYQNGQFVGPALTLEYNLADWNGHPIVEQLTAGGRFEWDGSPHFYPYK